MAYQNHHNKNIVTIIMTILFNVYQVNVGDVLNCKNAILNKYVLFTSGM